MKSVHAKLAGALGIAFGFILFQELALAVPKSAKHAVNPFGLTLGKADSVSDDLLAKVRATGVTFLRPQDVFVDEWNRSKGKCNNCDKLKKAKLGLILTVRNNGKTGEGKWRIPSTPPKDDFEYRKGLAEILQAYDPELLVVENKEDASSFYYDGTKRGTWDSLDDGHDTVEKYREQLKSACQVAHKLSYRCTNGGMSYDAVTLLTWSDYIKVGQMGLACDFAKRALAAPGNTSEAEKFCKVTSLDTIPSEPRKEISQYKRLIDTYRMSKIDFMNFHWRGEDAKALSEVVKYLRRATGKPVISNEIEITTKGDTNEAIRATLATIEKLRLSYAIWEADGGGNATVLMDDEGKLEPAGEEFVRYLRSRKN